MGLGAQGRGWEDEDTCFSRTLPRSLSLSGWTWGVHAFVFTNGPMAICHDQHKLFWLVSKTEKRFPESIRLESSGRGTHKPFSSQEHEIKCCDQKVHYPNCSSSCCSTKKVYVEKYVVSFFLPVHLDFFFFLFWDVKPAPNEEEYKVREKERYGGVWCGVNTKQHLSTDNREKKKKEQRRILVILVAISLLLAVRDSIYHSCLAISFKAICY